MLTIKHAKHICPHDYCLLSILRGFRNGVVYGARIRFPHALVMTFMFRSGTLQSKIKDILLATYTHSKNLGLFVLIYKTITCLLRHFRLKDDAWNAIIGGAVGGSLVFGTNTPINAQINMYVMSRVIFGLVNLATEMKILPTFSSAYTLYSAAIWALVMVLFERRPAVLQRSLTTSMEYLYHNSNSFPELPKNGNWIEWLLLGV
jgi:peroxisomal membrane protein 4